MRFYVFVWFFIVSCAARPQGPGLNNAYLPSLPSRSSADNVGGQETLVSELSSKTDTTVADVQTTEEPTRGTFYSESVDIIRQSTSIPNQPASTDSPSTTTLLIPSSTVSPAVRINVSGGNLLTTHIPQFETNPTTTVASATFNPGFASSTTPNPTNAPSFTPYPINTPITAAPQSSSTPLAPLHKPDQSQITETRFDAPKRPPTGSYLPTSDLINSIFQGQSSFGDGSYLGPPGVDSNYYGGAGQSHKSVYFFAAPDEDEAQSRLRINIIPSSEANTRVIFIKAPTYPAPIPEVISPPSDTVDKTLIYVLAQKPDSASSISIPVNTVVKPAKPEIFFIKYGSQQEAEQAITNGIKGYPVGQSIQDLANQQSFIHTIKDVVPNKGGSSSTTGGIKVSGTQTPSKGVGTGSSSTSKPSKGSQFGPAGESGPY